MDIKILIDMLAQRKDQAWPKRNDFCTIFVSKCGVGKNGAQL